MLRLGSRAVNASAVAATMASRRGAGLRWLSAFMDKFV